jgi:hypothetical protein
MSVHDDYHDVQPDPGHDGEIVRAEDLGLTPADVVATYPWAVTYHDDAGEPYWLRRDLSEEGSA